MQCPSSCDFQKKFLILPSQFSVEVDLAYDPECVQLSLRHLLREPQSAAGAVPRGRESAPRVSTSACVLLLEGLLTR